MSNFSNDLIENPSTRCACMLVLDTSGSMTGEPINELNKGVSHFIQAVQQDEVAGYSVEVGIISAGGNVRIEMPFTTAMDIDNIPKLQATGATPLGQAVQLALQSLDERKLEYQKAGVAYYQPWLVIISDGEPTDSWQHIASQTKDLSNNRKLVVLPLGVDGANLSILGEFSSKGAKKIAGLKFNEFFEWLSASMSRVSSSASTSASVKLPSTDSWDSI